MCGAVLSVRRSCVILSAMVDDDLAGIMAQALADACEKVLDDFGQTEHAARAVVAVRPDITDGDAMRVINRWRQG